MFIQATILFMFAYESYWVCRKLHLALKKTIHWTEIIGSQTKAPCHIFASIYTIWTLKWTVGLKRIFILLIWNNLTTKALLMWRSFKGLYKAECQMCRCLYDISRYCLLRIYLLSCLCKLCFMFFSSFQHCIFRNETLYVEYCAILLETI